MNVSVLFYLLGEMLHSVALHYELWTWILTHNYKAQLDGLKNNPVAVTACGLKFGVCKSKIKYKH